jgi:hypothetical protein
LRSLHPAAGLRLGDQISTKCFCRICNCLTLVDFDFQSILEVLHSKHVVDTLQSVIKRSAIVGISDYKFCACSFECFSSKFVWATHEGMNPEIPTL